MSFGAACEAFWKAQQSRWRNNHVRSQWLPFMERHAARIWEVPVDQVDQRLMVIILTTLWGVKHVTAQRLLHRCGQVLDYSRVMGWRSGANPARFRGELEYALPKRPANVNVKHLAATPLSELPALMERLKGIESIAAMAARFTILTASRPGEAFKATWSEIDLKTKLWILSPERYKTGRGHIVPLSPAALAILDQCPCFEGNNFVFPSPFKRVAPISPMAVILLFQRYGIKTTLHGTARSTFSDWAHDFTETPSEIIEECLGHQVGNSVRRAYRRGAAIEKRRALLELWAKRLTGEQAGLGTGAMAAE
jgi:integrase